jgi:hypothetical protein
VANDWIDYSQSYYKFPITEKGVYRISYQDLQSAGIPLLAIQPNDFQLFARGEEQPIYIPNPSDGSFDPTDFIEFYAEPNDGWLDTVLYGSADQQPNPYYSLLNDTIYYYLSWSSGNHLRYLEENNINFGNYFATNRVWKKTVLSLNSTYYDGEPYPGGATDPFYTPEEGWMGPVMNLGQSRVYSLNMSGHQNNGPPVELKLNLVGASDPAETNDHHIEVSAGPIRFDTIFDGYQLISLQRDLPAAAFFDGNNSITLRSIDDLGAPVDRTALAFISVNYPSSMNFNNSDYVEFGLDDNLSQSASLIEVANFNATNQVILYDLSNNKRVRVVQSLNAHRAIVPNSGGRKRCLMLNPSRVRSIPALEAVSANTRFTNFEALLSDTTFLILTHNQLFNAATNYAAYRRSTGFEVEIFRMRELYDQYGYGIPTNPLAIRNLIDDNLNNWSNPISHLLLLGKSVDAKSYRKNAVNQNQNLVPTMGNPATDNLLISGINAPQTVPAIPIGRVSAQNPTEVSDYLNKLIEYETAPPSKWMKEALHFAGGRSEQETRIYELYLNDYAVDFEGEGYGGRVRLFKKSSSAPIQTSLADSIRSLINGGVSLMTFFGHASANDGFDISIDTPDKLQNRGKYPLMLANSCFTGNYHQPNSVSTGEDYVLEKNKGAIAYIATGNLGYAFYLNQYSRIFYEKLTDEFYGAEIAEVMRQTAIELAQSNPNAQFDRVAWEMSLQGDPAFSLNAFPRPDYRIRESEVDVLPTEVTTDLDSFEIRINAENIGRAITDTTLLLVRRGFPNAYRQDTSYIFEVEDLFYERSLSFKLPIDPFQDIGSNSIEIIIDPFDQTIESDELNNRYQFEVLIRSGEILPLYPYDEGIVGTQSPTLTASTAFAFEEDRVYVFELDTSVNFNSPFKQTTNISSSGGLLEWQPQALASMSDSAVYFWRVSKLPLAGENFNWKTHSFTYLSGRSGWAQSDFDQLAANQFLFLERDVINQRLNFTDNVKELSVFTKSSPTISETFGVRYAVDADTRERNACGPQPGFLIAVLDSLSLESWETPYGGANQDRYYGQANFDNYCGTNRQRTEKYFLFRQTEPAQMDTLRNFLLNEIPDGNYIVAYTWQNVDYSLVDQQDTSILGAFRQLGSTLIDSLQDDEPFIFTVKKGFPNSVQEVKGFSATDEIELSRILVTSADFGEMNSGRIGASENWEQFSYRLQALEASDSIEISLEGLNGNSQTLFQSTSLASDSVLPMPSSANAYKELQFKLRVEDRLSQSPPKFDFWHIYYEILPDLAFAPNRYQFIPQDTSISGKAFIMQLAYGNSSPQAVDSIPLNITLFNATGNRLIDRDTILSPLSGNQYDTLRLSLPTISLSGDYRLLLELNPDQSLAEQYRFNNVAEYFFKVLPDRNKPLLDVTFDGRRIMNRELVSARPEILIQLEDDNQFLALDDTSSFSIFLRRPNGQEELINFAQNDRLIFTPASLPDNKAKVFYQPELNVDGVYQLRIQARDKSGNSSSQTDYAIEFEVVNRSTVSYLLNYPNPFSTSTRFVFTLTGSRVPDQIQIQIMTVTGKVVKNIDQFEIGPIHIGKNMTEYAWDGKDDYGDQLANGVYLYTVKMRIDGNNIEHRQSAADKFFTKEFGKMYLLR